MHGLIDKFSIPVTYKKVISEKYSEEEGLPQLVYETITLMASVQPVRKKGSIGGETEIYVNIEPDGNWEQGAFILVSKSDFKTNIKDEIEDLTLNGRNYGDAFIDRQQDWASGNGLYKVRIILKSIYPTREDYENAQVL